MPSTAPITVQQANDVTVDLAVKQSDGVTPQNLTSYTVQMVVKPAQLAADQAGTTLTTSSGLTIVSAPGGTLTAKLTEAMLARAGSQWYRLDLVDGFGNRTTAIEGLITVAAG